MKNYNYEFKKKNTVLFNLIYNANAYGHNIM